MRPLGTLIILLGVAGNAFALVPVVPEIDANSAVAAIALISGGLLVMRSRAKK